MSTKLEQIRAQLNGETAKADWSELVKFYAKGQLLHVHAQLDLIEVAAHIALDDTRSIQQWMLAGQLAQLDDATALRWETHHPGIWTVVVAPWILVQERTH